MDDPVVAQKAPYPVAVTKGKTYFWCACGRSAGQPFCDGSHKGTGIEPLPYKAAKDGDIYFCGCKATKAVVVCDGSHNKL